MLQILQARLQQYVNREGKTHGGTAGEKRSGKARVGTASGKCTGKARGGTADRKSTRLNSSHSV